MSGPILRWIRPSLNKPALPSWQCQLVHMVHFLESHNVWSHICAFPQLGENIFLRIIIIFINLHFFQSISSIFKLNIVVLMPCLMSISCQKRWPAGYFVRGTEECWFNCVLDTYFQCPSSHFLVMLEWNWLFNHWQDLEHYWHNTVLLLWQCTQLIFPGENKGTRK